MHTAQQNGFEQMRPLWKGIDGYAYQFQNHRIQPLLCNLDLNYHHDLVVPIGCMFRDIVEYHDGEVMRVNLRYVTEKYRFAMQALRDDRDKLQQETTTAQFDTACQAWIDLTERLREDTGVPEHIMRFGLVFELIAQKKWDLVQLWLSRILFEQIQERWRVLGKVEHDTDTFAYLLSCGGFHEHSDAAPLGRQLRDEVVDFMSTANIQ